MIVYLEYSELASFSQQTYERFIERSICKTNKTFKMWHDICLNRMVFEVENMPESVWFLKWIVGTEME